MYFYTSFESDLRMVVFPALSNPKTKIRNSYFFFFLRFLNIPINPPPCVLLIYQISLNFYQLSNLLIQNSIFLKNIIN